MKIPFSKYQGTGNDFIIIDNRSICWEPTPQQVSFLCDRHFGIGADGLMLLSAMPGFDFAMRYYNADGFESTMCGNGGRCMTAFARSIGLAGNKVNFRAADGSHVAEVHEYLNEQVYRLKMKDTHIEHIYHDGIFLDTGSPHLVLFARDVENLDVYRMGMEVRNDARFAPDGTNVDFVELQAGGLYVRTFERGVENETLSCGTGVTASAIAAASKDPGNQGVYEIKTPGGALKVSFTQTGEQFTNIWLEGVAKGVFEGEVDV